MISRVHDDLHAKLGKHCFGEGDTPALHKDVDDAARKIGDFLCDKQFIVGDQLTFVDFSVFELLDHMNFCSKGRTMQDNENLREYFKRVEELPGFKEFWQDDKRCPKSGFKPWFATLNN